MNHFRRQSTAAFEVFDREMGRWVNKAFELRQRGDYREYFEVTRDQAADLVAKAGQFVSIVRSHLDSK
jgi:uncharacterized protein (UPF0332 family)